jgi:hypothetical protein
MLPLHLVNVSKLEVRCHLCILNAELVPHRQKAVLGQHARSPLQLVLAAAFRPPTTPFNGTQCRGLLFLLACCGDFFGVVWHAFSRVRAKPTHLASALRKLAQRLQRGTIVWLQALRG